MNFERNVSPKTPRDIEAEGLMHRISEHGEQGLVNIDYIRFVERAIMAEWLGEGYSLQAFSDKRGYPIIIGRHERELDDRATPNGADVRYRLYLESGTRDVVIPGSMTGEVPSTIDRGNVTVFDTSLPEVTNPTEDIEWLKAQFGDYLKIVRRHLEPTRLETDAGVIGIALEDLSLFRESDF
jgi:hypothetical protein